jgi:large conductance mechanosensitive channel
MGMMQEFKEFAMRGNVIDLAVGVVIGAAFGKIVTALVEKVIMPPIGYLTGGIDFGDLKLVIQSAVVEGGAVVQPEVAIGYGEFLNTLVQFLLIAFALFLVIKAINRLKREAPTAPAEPPAQEKLLAEIRDLLKARSA